MGRKVTLKRKGSCHNDDVCQTIPGAPLPTTFHVEKIIEGFEVSETVTMILFVKTILFSANAYIKCGIFSVSRTNPEQQDNLDTRNNLE